MAIIVQEEKYLIIAPRRVKLLSGRYYYPLSSICLYNNGVIKTTCVQACASSFGSLAHFQVATCKVDEEHTTHYIRAIHPKYAFGTLQVNLPNNMSKRQVKQVQDYLDKYFNKR